VLLEDVGDLSPQLNAAIVAADSPINKKIMFGKLC
jgi:hypothetical protein